MISEVCAEIRNYFVLSGDVLVGDYRIEDGSVVPSCPFLDGQYYRIVGSVFNDGVHKHGEETLTDEPQFHGAIWLMRVPKDFLQLADEIAQWQAKNGGVTYFKFNAISELPTFEQVQRLVNTGHTFMFLSGGVNPQTRFDFSEFDIGTYTISYFIVGASDVTIDKYTVYADGRRIEQTYNTNITLTPDK